LQPGASLAVVGGGVIGLEVAAAAIKRGCSVTVIELADRLIARSVPPLVSGVLQREHEKRGVAFRFGVSATGSRPRQLVLSDGSTVAADLAVVGIGVETELSFARALCDDPAAGIPVDGLGRTRCDRVFCAGDAALQSGARVETWANAQNQAIRVAANMVGKPLPYDDPTWFWSDQYDLNLQVVGDPRTDDIVVRGQPDSARFTLIGLAGGRIAGAVTLNAPRDMGALRRLTAQRARVDRADLENPQFDLRRVVPKQ
jgi:p-cumate 2,3-dioxygenase ferredoxin reductase subunit